jgi:hypothetical protein
MHVVTSPKLSATTFLLAASDDDDAQPKAEHWVSYIGGDPCGSKYNDDPFDLQGQTPGMPDNMKARIHSGISGHQEGCRRTKSCQSWPNPPLTSARKSQPTI